MPAYEVCYKCNGAGLQDGMFGPVSCYVCKGNCMIVARDSKGRFKPDLTTKANLKSRL